MFVRGTVSLVVFLLSLLVIPASLSVLAVEKPYLYTPPFACHDGVWEDGEFCGRDAYSTTGIPDMNHDCRVDGLDVGLFALQYGMSGADLSADFNDDGIVNELDDYFIMITKMGLMAFPCNGLLPSTCEGSIALSFSSNPATIVDNVSQAPGTYTAYVIVDNVVGGQIFEYAIQTSENVVILSHTPVSPVSDIWGPICLGGYDSMVFTHSAPLGVGPALVATVEYRLTDANPATLKIGQGPCSYARVRWAETDAAVSHSFEDVSHAGINGSTPPSVTPECVPIGTIAGTVYGDMDADCIFDIGTELPVAGRMIVVTPGPYYGSTDLDGNFSIAVPVLDLGEQYTVTQATILQDPYRLQTCQSSASYLVTVVANTTASGNDFALIPFGTIAGTAYYDVANDCVFIAAVDFPIPGFIIEANPGGYVAFTDANGNYEFKVPYGTYTVSFSASNAPWIVQPCQPPPYVVNVPVGGAMSGKDFATLTTGTPLCDATVQIVSNGIVSGLPACHGWLFTTPCPSFEHEYLFAVHTYQAFSAPIAAGALLDITLGVGFTISNVSCAQSISTVSSSGPNQRTIQFDDPLPPGFSYVVRVRATPSNGGPYQTSVVFNGVGFCSLTESASMTEVSACACDPNDKAVTPAGCGPNGNVPGDEPFTYKIRFENVGPGPAHNIFIEDVLDDDLDFTSLRVVDSSHPVTGVQINPGNLMVINFDNIELPGTYDLNGNKGYVTFTIDPLPGLPEGTTIENTAAITFDANEKVITNTTLNTIRSVPSPNAAFASVDTCVTGSPGASFSYTGSTADNATFAWDFGPDATPTTSTLQNPSGIAFASAGNKSVTLTVTRFGCEAVVTDDVTVVACTPTGAGPNGMPTVHSLAQNHPNPFNPSTTIEYALATSEHVTIAIFDVKGARVKTIVDAPTPAGWHRVVWDGLNSSGSQVASGVYLYRMQAGAFVQTKRLVLLK